MRQGALQERLQVSPLSHSPAAWAQAQAQALADRRQSIRAGGMQDLFPGITPRLAQSLAMAQPV
jgi:hypothetical protein